MEYLDHVVTNLLFIFFGVVLTFMGSKGARLELFYKFNPQYEPAMVLGVGKVAALFYWFTDPEDPEDVLAATVTAQNEEMLRSVFNVPALRHGDVLVLGEDRHVLTYMSSKTFNEHFIRATKEN